MQHREHPLCTHEKGQPARLVWCILHNLLGRQAHQWARVEAWMINAYFRRLRSVFSFEGSGVEKLDWQGKIEN